MPRSPSSAAARSAPPPPYFLAREGRTDIQLLERAGLCEATSSQAAGIVGQARPTVDRARLTMAAAEVYRGFERETGYSMDYRECGAVRLALSDASVAELDADRRDGRGHRPAGGVPVGRAAARDLPGAASEPSRQGRAVVPHRRIPPAEQPGGRLHRRGQGPGGHGRPARRRDRHRACATARSRRSRPQDGELPDRAGDHRGRALVGRAGRGWPGWSCRSSRCCTSTSSPSRCPGWHADLPCLRIPEVQVYARGESDRVLCGGFENPGTSIDPREVTVRRAAARRPARLGRARAASRRAWARSRRRVAEAGVATTFQGWPAFSPDGRFVVGPVSADPGPGHGGRLQRARGVRFGGPGHAPGGEPGPGSVAVRPVAQPGPVHPPRTWSWEDARREAQAVYETYYPMPARGDLSGARSLDAPGAWRSGRRRRSPWCR